jgi:hypothetical protein
MQSEQTVSQTKKQSSTKKEKKSSKVQEPQVVVEQNTVAQAPVVEVAPTPAPVVQEQNVKTELNAESVVGTVQEADFETILNQMNFISDKLTEVTKFFKENTLSRDERGKVEIAMKKLSKAFSTSQQGYYDQLSKQVSILEKSFGSKSGGKKVTDKTKAAIHKKLPVHPFLLSFMKLEPNTLVSRSDTLTAITRYVKQEKETNTNILVPNDKMKFKVIGELAPLFKGIEQIMTSKGLLEGKSMPSELKYTEIMTYMNHCFIKDEPTVV